MRARIQYDIDTLRKGSLVFDLMIIARTLAVVWRDQNAYCGRGFTLQDKADGQPGWPRLGP